MGKDGFVQKNRLLRHAPYSYRGRESRGRRHIIPPATSKKAKAITQASDGLRARIIMRTTALSRLKNALTAEGVIPARMRFWTDSWTAFTVMLSSATLPEIRRRKPAAP